MTSETEEPDLKAESTDYWCPECGSPELDEAAPADGAICTACGWVIEDLEEAQEPVSVPASNEDQDALGSWSEHYSVSNSTEQQIGEALEILEEIGDELHIDADVREDAARVFADAAVENLPDGRPMEQTVAAAIVVATRAAGVPRPNARVASVADTSVNALTRVLRQLYSDLDYRHPGFECREYLPYLCRELGIGDEQEEAAYAILEAVEKAEQLSGTHPGGFVGAALYLATDGGITQHEIALAVGISTETIRVRLEDCRRVVEDR